MDQDNIIELFDEDGNSVEFDHIATVEYEGEYYIVLAPVSDDPEEEEDDGVVIMHIEQDENGEDCYVGVTDPELEQNVFETYLEWIEEEGELAEDDGWVDEEDGGEDA